MNFFFGDSELDDGVDPVPEVCNPGHDSWLVSLGATNAPGNDPRQVIPTIRPLCHHGATRVTLRIIVSMMSLEERKLIV